MYVSSHAPDHPEAAVSYATRVCRPADVQSSAAASKTAGTLRSPEIRLLPLPPAQKSPPALVARSHGRRRTPTRRACPPARPFTNTNHRRAPCPVVRWPRERAPSRQLVSRARSSRTDLGGGLAGACTYCTRGTSPESISWVGRRARCHPAPSASSFQSFRFRPPNVFGVSRIFGAPRVDQLGECHGDFSAVKIPSLH